MSEYTWTAGSPKRVPEQLPPKTYITGGLHIVDLTKVLNPNTESRRCRLWRYNTGGAIPDFHTIMDLTSHLGTHCECPYHHDEQWPSVAELPLTNFMGRCRYITIRGVKPRGIITAAVLEEQATDIRPGDTVIFDSEYKIPPFTPLTNTEADKRLSVNGETAQWLADRGVQCVGFGDGVSIEDCEENVKPFDAYKAFVESVDSAAFQGVKLTFDELGVFYYDEPHIASDNFCVVRRMKLQ